MTKPQPPTCTFTTQNAGAGAVVRCGGPASHRATMRPSREWLLCGEHTALFAGSDDLELQHL